LELARHADVARRVLSGGTRRVTKLARYSSAEHTYTPLRTYELAIDTGEYTRS
jgi:hypothetical protein